MLSTPNRCSEDYIVPELRVRLSRPALRADCSEAETKNIRTCRHDNVLLTVRHKRHG